MSDGPSRYEWQNRETEDHAYDRGGIIAAEPRMGKTLCAIDSWIKAGGPKGRTLIVSPLVAKSVWAAHLNQSGLRSTTSLGSLARDGTTTLVTNYDRLKGMYDDLERWGPQYIILDESHLIKGISTNRARIARKLCQTADWVRLLSGTPAPNGYQDLWSQLACCDVKEWGKFFGPYRDRYCICDSQYRTRVLSYRNVEELKARIAPYIRYYTRKDVFGPDSWQENVRHLDLPPNARRLYDQVANEWFSDELNLDATHTLARMTRLQQIAGCGVEESLHTTKLEAVAEDAVSILEAGERCVIFHRYELEGTLLAMHIAMRAKGRFEIGRISGATSEKSRAELIWATNHGKKPAALVVQIASGGVGIDLSNVQHALFASLTFSYAEYKQARDRIYKPGESRSVTNYVMNRTIDGFMMKVLARKEELHASLQRHSRDEIALG